MQSPLSMHWQNPPLEALQNSMFLDQTWINPKDLIPRENDTKKALSRTWNQINIIMNLKG